MSFDLAILLCTYNGEKFLQQQLESFNLQSYKDWQLFVYDDGSTDNTKAIVEAEKQRYKETDKINFISNPVQRGFVGNFLNAIASTSADLDFYAFSDQDDVWLEDKLERAVAYLKEAPDHIPALYCSRTTLIDEVGNKIGFSPLFQRAPSFSNALVQSIAGGNTMVFNNAARDLIAKAGPDLDVVSHDWFIYQLITGAGGKVYYDAYSEILYRQHGNNLIGSNMGMFAKLSRLRLLLKGSFKSWNDRNMEALVKNIGLLTQENQDKLRAFVKAREKALILRMIAFAKCGIYRQTFFGNIALFIGGILNKI